MQLLHAVFFLICATNAHCANILGIFMSPSYSHQSVYQPIWRELSLQGHQVTVVTPNPLNDPSLVNLTEIDIGAVSYKVWAKSNLAQLAVSKGNTFDVLNELYNVYSGLSDAQLGMDVLKELRDNKNNAQYDLFLVEFLWPIMYAYKDVYKCPMVGISSLPIGGNNYEALGLRNHPVLFPEIIFPVATDLVYSERIRSVFMDLLIRAGAYLKFNPSLNAALRKHFGPDVRDVNELVADVSLVLHNSNAAVQNIRPVTPQIVEVPGLHLKPRGKLPQDLQRILDGNGVIYFSLGTNVKAHLLSPRKLQLFMDALADLPYTILWRFETDDFPKLPGNVVVRKWLPQQDILAHANVKLFITQGGLQSIDEAVFHGVPMLIVPLLSDQKFNADMLRKKGAALTLDYHTFTSEEMRGKIMRLIDEPVYRETMHGLSKAAFDQPMTSLEKATWHINYVLRHKGAPHLKYKMAELPFYQYYMLDVYAAIFSAVLFVLVIFYQLGKLFVRFLCKLFQ